MKFKTLNGKERFLKNAKKYIINWEAKSKSNIQWRVKQFLLPYWKHDVVFEEMRIVGTRLSLDFYNANKKIAIEVQGKQHQTYNPHFHSNNRQNWLLQLKRDDLKLKFCLTNGIKLVEVYETDTLSKEFFENIGI
jgi:very-short-patch-repair endonuclease